MLYESSSILTNTQRDALFDKMIFLFLSIISIFSSISLSSCEEYPDLGHNLQGNPWKCSSTSMIMLCSRPDLASFCKVSDYCTFGKQQEHIAGIVHDSNGDNEDTKVLLDSSGDFSKVAISGDVKKPPGFLSTNVFGTVTYDPPLKDKKNNRVFGRVAWYPSANSDNEFPYGKMVYDPNE
ncbi:uncharacterized protein [Fopius arisanus]|uniref:Uncharacterized protein n=1 Tax=Fopius arisanus TaxID=64838 RepID=A0A9R1U1K2_9HYME|nr:PREDICTED: uncharacterized protein LOC105268088 [Fopius arisanus]